jgi:thiamine-phosphate pyrophosphorylase
MSTHDEGQLGEADREPAVDWVALGPIFPTRSKRNPDPTVGLERLREARRLTAKPLIAIGGIDLANVAAVLEAGADSAALLQAVSSGDIGRSCRELLSATA